MSFITKIFLKNSELHIKIISILKSFIYFIWKIIFIIMSILISIDLVFLESVDDLESQVGNNLDNSKSIWTSPLFVGLPLFLGSVGLVLYSPIIISYIFYGVTSDISPISDTVASATNILDSTDLDNIIKNSQSISNFDHIDQNVMNKVNAGFNSNVSSISNNMSSNVSVSENLSASINAGINSQNINNLASITGVSDIPASTKSISSIFDNYINSEVKERMDSILNAIETNSGSLNEININLSESINAGINSNSNLTTTTIPSNSDISGGINSVLQVFQENLNPTIKLIQDSATVNHNDSIEFIKGEILSIFDQVYSVIDTLEASKSINSNVVIDPNLIESVNRSVSVNVSDRVPMNEFISNLFHKITIPKKDFPFYYQLFNNNSFMVPSSVDLDSLRPFLQATHNTLDLFSFAELYSKNLTPERYLAFKNVIENYVTLSERGLNNILFHDGKINDATLMVIQEMSKDLLSCFSIKMA